MYKNILKLFLILTFSIFILHLSPGCKKDLTPVNNDQPEIKLTVEDVGVTEAWLRFSIQNPSPKSQITITRNDSVIQSRKTGPSAHDTLIYDSGLLPSHNYTYTATLTTDSRTLTAESQITTMDTTSHDFTWQAWAFGDGSYSILHDVAIISPDNIWAVGKIGIIDSAGNYEKYNAVHWNGIEWELKRILYQGGFWTIEAIHAFSENDIWFEPFVHWDGNEFNEKPIPGIFIGKSINKMWGTSSDDLYVVGNDGLIAHYNGQTWQLIESGSNLPIKDIWGAIDSNEHFVLCPASEIYQVSDKKLIKINNDFSTEEIDWPFQNRRVHSVWFKDKLKIFICGAGVFVRNRAGEYKEFTELPLIFSRRIRGNNINDIMVAGDFSLLAHYNGYHWKELCDFDEIGLFYSLDFKNDIAVAVGEDNSKSVIYMGKSN